MQWGAGMVSFINESVAVELAPSRSPKAPRTPEGIKQRKYRLLAILGQFRHPIGIRDLRAVSFGAFATREWPGVSSSRERPKLKRVTSTIRGSGLCLGWRAPAVAILPLPLSACVIEHVPTHGGAAR
jgi:hypothetical protein